MNPRLIFHLLSLRAIPDNGHTFFGYNESDENAIFLLVGRLKFLYAYRPGTLVDEIAKAVIAPTPIEPST